MAGGAADLLQELEAPRGRGGLLAKPGLEVVQEVELQIVNERGVNFIDYPIAITILRAAGYWRSFDGVLRAIEDHPGRCHTRAPMRRVHQAGIIGLQTHLILQGTHDKLADRDRAAMRKQRPHAQVWIDADDPGGVDVAIREGHEGAVL